MTFTKLQDENDGPFAPRELILSSCDCSSKAFWQSST